MIFYKYVCPVFCKYSIAFAVDDNVTALNEINQDFPRKWFSVIVPK